MPTVTAIEEIPDAPRNRRHRRLIVFADADSVELDHALAISAGISEGATISHATLAALVEKDRYQSAVKDALNIISRRDRSETELRKALHMRQHGDTAIDAVIARCKEWGYVDDARFARQLVNDAIHLKRLGTMRIKRQLSEAGVDEALAHEAIARAAEDAPPPVELALAALATKRRGYARLDVETARRRMYGFLQRRGFDFATVRAAVERFERELRTGDDESAHR